MLPLVAIPTALLWIIAVILAIVNPGPIWGVSHHTYTGILFALALVLSIVCFVISQRAEKSNSNRLNGFVLPLVLLVILPYTSGVCLFVFALFILLFRVKTQEYGESRYAPTKWYNHPKFSLVPQLTLRPGNEHNTAGFYFDWLFFRLWSLDHAAFEVGIAADTHWGIGVLGILPYLRWVCCIPCPDKVGMWLSGRLQRRPKQESVNDSRMSVA